MSNSRVKNYFKRKALTLESLVGLHHNTGLPVGVVSGIGNGVVTIVSVNIPLEHKSQSCSCLKHQRAVIAGEVIIKSAGVIDSVAAVGVEEDGVVMLEAHDNIGCGQRGDFMFAQIAYRGFRGIGDGDNIGSGRGETAESDVAGGRGG